LGRSPKWYQKSKNLGFLEFSDSYAKKISGQNSHFFENFVFDFLEKVENFFNFFFTKRKFRPRPIFWFLFHQNRTTRKYFLRGCTTVGGGSVARRWKNFQNQILIGTQVIFYIFCRVRPNRRDGTPPQKCAKLLRALILVFF